MISVDIKLVGEEKLIDTLKNFLKDANVFEEPLENAAKYMQQQAIANFAAKGRVMGEGWRKLSPVTEEIKARDWPGSQMMVRTGLLKSAFLIMGPRIGKNYGEIEVYNPIKYAIEHQKGTSRLPQRILLKFQKQQVENIVNITTRWLDKIINKSFK